MSTRGNGYIFLVPRSNTLQEIDSKDVLFNETFSDCRDRQGKIIARGTVIPPDLTDEPHPPADSADYQDGIVRDKISLPAPRFRTLLVASLTQMIHSRRIYGP
jgi:hypothetical protein